jgi:hypothetical protein
MAHIGSTTAPGPLFLTTNAAGLRIGADGISKVFGIATDFEMRPRRSIYFDRISDPHMDQ